MPAAFKRAQRRLNKRVVNANGRNLDLQFLDAKLLFQFGLNRVPALRTQPANALVRVISRKRRQVHAGDRSQKPSCLPFFFPPFVAQREIEPGARQRWY